MELLTPWMSATVVDFYINIFALAVWICYKESSIVSSVVWVILLICFGSITTCAYISVQLTKLSPHLKNVRKTLSTTCYCGMIIRLATNKRGSTSQWCLQG